MVAHGGVDVQALGCDFYVFSGHKLFGPTGTGVLWGRRELLEAMPPYHGGGDMIRTVSFEKTTYADLPNKFEAGTPDIAGIVGLGAAIDYVTSLDRDAIRAHEADLLAYATAQLAAIPGLRIIGTARHKVAIVSFVMTSPPLDHHTLGTLLDGEGVAVRTGHHCCMPLMDRLGLAGTTRASFSFYNTRDDVDRLVAAIKKIRAALGTARTPAPSTGSELVFAPASAASIREAAQVILDDFELFDDWEQRHDYMIDLGKKVPPLPTSMKIEPHRVHGCQSTVYMVARKQPGSEDRIGLAAESDAFIVNGLIAILLSIYSGQRAGEILSFDIDAFFAKLGLTHHLSMGRRNGLAGMVSRVRNLAAMLTHPGTSAEDAA
jgi:cysteine desulfurase/selenocysteine lyase